MEDILGRIVASILVIAGIFIVPLIIIFNNVDATQRSYADNVTQTFSEQCKTTGYISKASYTNFVESLYKLGGPYKITIMHKSKTIVPYKDGEYRTAYKYYNLEDIESCIYNDGDYVMKDGDYITITVKTLNQTIGSTVYSAATQTYLGEKMYCTAGGMIGNTKR